jgi:hypothetical protein
MKHQGVANPLLFFCVQNRLIQRLNYLGLADVDAFLCSYDILSFKKCTDILPKVDMIS